MAGVIHIPESTRIHDIPAQDFPRVYISSRATTYIRGRYGEYVQERYWEQLGYRLIGGHGWTLSTQGGLDGYYQKVQNTPENEGLPKFVASDAKLVQSEARFGHGQPHEDLMNWTLEDMKNSLSQEDFAAMIRDGFVIVRTQSADAGSLSADDPYSTYTEAMVHIEVDAIVFGGGNGLAMNAGEVLPEMDE